MADKLTWRDALDVGIALYEAHPDQHPLELGFVALHKLVTALKGFDDDPKASNEKYLEGIQMAWYDEWRVDHG